MKEEQCSVILDDNKPIHVIVIPNLPESHTEVVSAETQYIKQALTIMSKHDLTVDFDVSQQVNGTFDRHYGFIATSLSRDGFCQFGKFFMYKGSY